MDGQSNAGRIAEAFVMGMFVILVTGAGLWIAIDAGSTEALMIAAVLVTIFLMAMGGAIVLGILLFANRMTEKRELREQSRFQDNVRENLAIMAATARVQGAQTQAQNSQVAGLLRQIREYQHQLPAPGDNGNIDALVVDDAVFDELE